MIQALGWVHETFQNLQGGTNHGLLLISEHEIIAILEPGCLNPSLRVGRQVLLKKGWSQLLRVTGFLLTVQKVLEVVVCCTGRFHRALIFTV